MSKRSTIFFLLAILLSGSPVFAAVSVPTVAGLPAGATVAELVAYFFNLAVTVGSFIAVVMMVMAGIDYVMSQGNPAKIEDAKKRIQNTFFGVVVLMASLLILNTINPDLAVIKINELSKEEQPGINIEELQTIGVYLYKADGKSLNLKTSAPSLVSQDFQNQTQSVKFENSESYRFGAILFSDDDFKGNCAYALNNVDNLGVANGRENNPPVGINNLSSIQVFRALNGFPTIKIFNTIDCDKRSDEYGTVDEKTSVCTIKGKEGFENIKDVCPDFEGSVVSILATTDTGVLLKAADKDSAGRCQYFVAGNSQCINTLKYSYVYTQDGSIKPISLVLFPLYSDQ
jgi:hypothetical protein